MNGSVTPQWEPLVSPLPREAHVSRFPTTSAFNVLLAASVVLVAVTILSQNAPRDLRLSRDSFRLYRENSIVLTAAKVIPQSAPAHVSPPVPRTLPRTSTVNSTQTPTGVTLTSPIALSQSMQPSAPPAMADGLTTQHEAAITEWPVRSLELQAAENASALSVPSGTVDRPVMTIAGPMQWPSNGAAASCRWPACQFPMIAPPVQNNASFIPLPPQLSDPWAFSFASRLANQYSEVWEMLVLPVLGKWGGPLQMGAFTVNPTPSNWQISMQTRIGLNVYAGNQVASPLSWFGYGGIPGVGLQTTRGQDVIFGSSGLQVFQTVKTPLGPLFGGITPYGPLVGGVFTSGSVSAYAATLLSEGQPKVAGGITLQLGSLTLGYSDTTTNRGYGLRFTQGPLDLSFAMMTSETQLSFSYTPPSGPTVLAYWSTKTGLNFLVMGSLNFESRSPARVQEYAAPAPATPGVNH